MGPAVIQTCLELTLGAALIPVREPNNPHDANAVLLLSLYGAPVGYVQRAVAPAVAAAMDGGEVVFAKVVRAPNMKSGRLRMRLRYPRAVLWSDTPPAIQRTRRKAKFAPIKVNRITEKVDG